MLLSVLPLHGHFPMELKMAGQRELLSNFILEDKISGISMAGLRTCVFLTRDQLIFKTES